MLLETTSSTSASGAISPRVAEPPSSRYPGPPIFDCTAIQCILTSAPESSLSRTLPLEIYGSLIDLARIGERARMVDAALVVDGAQSVGAHPFSVADTAARLPHRCDI